MSNNAIFLLLLKLTNPINDTIKRLEGSNVKWQEVQQIFPNQFVKFDILHSKEKDNQEIIDDVLMG